LGRAGKSGVNYVKNNFTVYLKKKQVMNNYLKPGYSDPHRYVRIYSAFLIFREINIKDIIIS
jgi:hypothetical protein